MGRPYTRDLKTIPDVYNWALTTPIDKIMEFVRRSAKTPLYVIGSGGSLSSATYASLLHQKAGVMAKYLTPLEFLEYKDVNSDCSVMIITAGGNNTDILSVFDKAISLKIKNIGIICASTNNKLLKKARGLDLLVHAIDIPTGKEGFLATNSLIASMVWLCRAYMKIHVWPFKMLQLDELCSEWTTHNLDRELAGIVCRSTIVCLYDNWGKTAAVDLESKLVEAGLCNVQLADYRNFAHGRHNWLDKNKNETSVIAIVNPDCQKLADKTLTLIPEYIPQTRFGTGYEGPVASIALILQVLYAVNFFGTAKGIDPGKPCVARFGRKIYHLTIPRTVGMCDNIEKMAICRKFGHANPDMSETRMRLRKLREFTRDISKQKFGAIVFDYDGTICDSQNRFNYPSKEIRSLIISLLKNNISIGIATGRGRSVRDVLQKIIPNKWQSSIHIGYYNGGVIGNLADNFMPDDDTTIDEALTQFASNLGNKIMLNGSIIERRPKQISIQMTDYLPSNLTHTLHSIAKKYKNIKIVESTHSVDVLPSQVSKLGLVNHIQKKISQQLQVLCIGDKGEYPGNDFELLSTRFSLSVDETSKNLDSCWNVLPSGLYGEKGVLEYFKSAMFYDGYIKLSVKGDVR